MTAHIQIFVSFIVCYNSVLFHTLASVFYDDTTGCVGGRRAVEAVAADGQLSRSSLADCFQASCLAVEGLALQDLRHTVGGAIAINQTLQRYPVHGDASLMETLLQNFALSTDGHDVAWAMVRKLLA